MKDKLLEGLPNEIIVKVINNNLSSESLLEYINIKRLGIFLLLIYMKKIFISAPINEDSMENPGKADEF